MTLHKPMLPACFLHWTETANGEAEDVLRIVSWRRNLTLSGTSFADFEQQVLPLLDGMRTVDEICQSVGDTFRPEDVTAALDLLANQGIVVEGDARAASSESDGLKAQLGWLAETAPEGRAAQDRLERAHIVLFGAGLHGAVLARSLVASGIGRLTIIDPVGIAPTDPYFAGVFRAADVGRNRAETLVEALSLPGNKTKILAHSARSESESEITPLIAGATLVVCCLESAELSLMLDINMSCRKSKIPWLSSSLEGTEAVVGPGFVDVLDGPCFQCWRTREILSAAKPDLRVAVEKHLVFLKTDLSSRRENIAAAADIVGGMLCAEVMGWITGASLPTLDGSFLTIAIPGLMVEKHKVLRKPGCPVCSPAMGLTR